MIKDGDMAILIIGLLIWIAPFFPLMFEKPKSIKYIQARQDRELYITLFSVGVLFLAGIFGWGAVLYKLGLSADPLHNWKTAIPLIAIASISPIYSFMKWYRLQ